MGSIFFTKMEVKGMTKKQKEMLLASAAETVKGMTGKLVSDVLARQPKARAAVRRKLEPIRSRMKSSKE